MTNHIPAAGGAGLPDAALAQAAQRGEKKAFVEIVARHQAMVCGIAFGILGDFAASEDAAQEAFLTAWRKIHDLREPARLKPWLGQIARTAALGHLRRRHPDGSLDEIEDAEDDSLHPDEVAANDEEAALVRDALAKLPETFRVPLVLFYREGQSVRMVAEALDLSEDAVKQRLARGRDMLRDRMSGLIESVLSRTRPTAVFTMIIAAAIGALTAPAVVAGTAFTAAAATAGAASTSATAAGPVITAMSTSKTSIAVAALVAAVCLPLGYSARVGMEPPPTALAVAPQSQAADKPAAKKKEPDFSDSALFAEWRELHEIHGSSAEAMPLLYKAIADIKDPVRRRAFRAAQIAEWAAVAPEAGLAFFLEKGRDYAQREQFFNEWMQRDATAAVNALVASSGSWESVARASLLEIAKRVPGRVAEIVARLPKSDSYWDNKIRDAFGILAEGGLESARAAAEAITGINREQALAGVAKAWAKTDLEAAIAWAKALPDGVDRDEIIRGALIGLSSSKPGDALDKVMSVPPGGRQGYFATTTGARVLAEAAKADYDATVAWLAAHPTHMGQEDMMGMANAVTERLNADPIGFLKRHAADGSLSALMPAIGSAILNQAGGQRGAMWEWLKAQPESEALNALRDQIFNSAGYQDPELALKIVADLPQTDEGNKRVNSIAMSLLNGGTMLSRFDSLMAQAPERLREPLLAAAFQYLRADNLEDPHKWLARVAQAPEDQRANLTSRVGAAWAEQEPEEAMAWASTLPQGEARSGVIGSAAGSWAVKDAFSASEWISSLPAGPDKDSAAGSLATVIAGDAPEEAWQWALSISDSSKRSGPAMRALDAMFKRDPATARQWVEEAPLSAHEKERLREVMDRRAGASGSSPGTLQVPAGTVISPPSAGK